MSTSNTFAFNPSFGEMVTLAYGRCGVRRTAIVREHMEDARMEANMLLAEFANRGPNLWSVSLETNILVPGVKTYNVPAETVMVLDAYIRTSSGGVNTDRIITPVSRTDYASYPNKEQQGIPTVFWFDRGIAPTITLWQVPDASQAYTLQYYVYTQIQDASLPNGTTMDLPYRFLDAFVAGLAAKLALIYAPDRYDRLSAVADRSWTIAATQDVENTPVYVTPGTSGYWR